VYAATIEFQMRLKQLDRLEEVLVGITEAGANQIRQVDYQTSRMKELRDQSREQAVVAAREKAEAYGRAAGVALGPVIHIEDVDPDQPRVGHGATFEMRGLEEIMSNALDPGMITIIGAVRIAWEIVQKDT
jgi:uncharacterized protein YggE